jgi:excinuclease ABC subunit C
MQAAAKALQFERAAEYATNCAHWKTSAARSGGRTPQPEVFFDDPGKVCETREVLGLSAPPRTFEGIDIAHLQGKESCGSLVCFIDGKPFRTVSTVQDQDRRGQRRFREHS